jgi:hypothetical protein
MKIALLSQNVQGLNGQGKVELLQHYFRNHLNSLEILYFQEHKLRGDKLKELGNII